jgi:DDE domain/Putative transposase of IS4/5 family (DUF4096)
VGEVKPGCQWRAIPKDLPPKSTLYDYFGLWTYDGTLEDIHHALYVRCREQAQREASPTGARADHVAIGAKARRRFQPQTAGGHEQRKLLKKYGFVPDKLVTDDLRSYAAAAGHLGIAKRHERGQWRNNRAENSHQPTRRRECKMQGFKSPGSAQKFLSTHAAAYNTFNVQRHLTSAKTHRAFRATAMQTWRDVVAAA